MPVISYMGTKAALASEISASFNGLPSGPLLDLFAGMATIGRAVAPVRNVWLNDVQQFSRLTSELQFLNCDGSAYRRTAYRTARDIYGKHYKQLSAEFGSLLAKEDAALQGREWRDVSAMEIELRAENRSGPELAALFASKGSPDYRLFTGMYASTYFGIRQCIQLDALRKGIDAAAPEGDRKLGGVRRWMLAALGGAASRCSNSTGHFAQYLTASEENVRRVASQRRRSITREWVISLRTDTQVGNYAWRRNNRTFNLDACDLLVSLQTGSSAPSVIYADPPYTSDQYSRYYHILETLIKYDYPDVSGKGLYRPDRFVSSWSLKTKVHQSFRALIQNASMLKSALVISYPTNGLLEKSEQAIPDMLTEHFRSVNRLTPMSHQHSTMGASKGTQRQEVTEQIFVAS